MSATSHRDGEPAVSGSASPTGVRSKHPSFLSALGVTRFSGVYITAIFIAIFAVWVPGTFLTTTTLKDILSEQAITAMVAIGLLFPLAAGAFDLSVGNMLGASAMITASLTANHHVGVIAVILIVLGIGAAVGAVNGFLVVVVGVDSFIATLGMSSVLLAVIDKVGNGNFIVGVPGSVSTIALHQPLGIPIVAYYVVVLAVIGWYILEHTPGGRRLHATGANEDASRLSGVPTGRLRFLALIASATIAALAGFLLTAQLSSASPTAGNSYLLPAFAAALLGTTQILPGRVNVWGTILAIVLLAVGVKGLQLAGASLWVTDLFNGVALIIAVAAASLSKRGALSRWGTRWRQRRTSRTEQPQQGTIG